MDIEKLIEQLRTESLYADKATLEIMDLCMDAATALSTLQAENKRLNKIVCSIPTTPDSGRTVSQYDKEMSMCAYLDDLEAENEKLRNEVERQRRSADDRKHLYENAERAYMKVVAELEQVKRERDAAVSWAQKYTESIDMPCVACKHNTGDYVCTAICGNCGPMGAESCKWEFDFSGELKED